MPNVDALYLSFLPVSHAWQLWLFHLTAAWLLVWAGHFVLRAGDTRYAARPWPWHRLFGLVLVLFPFVRITYAFIVSIPVVVTPGTVVVARPPEYWWMVVQRNLVLSFLVPLTGLFLASGGGTLLARRPERVRAAVRETLSGVGLWPRHSWSRDLATGCALAVVIFFAYLALHVLLFQFREFDTGDSSQTFLRITLPLAFALAAMAGLTEELIYRGLLVLRVRALVPRVPSAVVVVLAAVVFGLAHAGYGTIANMLFPFLLGVLLGFLVLWLGVWPAVIVHAFVNLMIFLAVLTTRDPPAPGSALATLLVFSFVVLFPLVHFGRLIVQRWTRRGGAPPPSRPARRADGAPATASAPIEVRKRDGRNA